MKNKNGLFITVEGGEGAGKTTILHRLKKEVENKGIPVITTREPGGIEISEKIRLLILDPNHTNMDSRTEALLYAAARRQHLVEKVIPALLEGKVVLCDRFIDSSLAYQGYARGIGMEDVMAINDFAISECMPDLTLYFDVDPNIGLTRIHNNDGREVNRLDLETTQFHDKVREGYQKLVERFPNRIKKIDANHDEDTVFQEALYYFQKLLPDE